MPGSTPSATVAIPVYNGEGTIERAITSATEQTFRDTEILILDNASTDSTQSICERLASDDPRVRYERNSSNIGLLPNFNRIFGLARGTYLRWLGAHDWLAPTYLERCVPALESSPQSIGASCHQAWVSDRKQSCEEYEGPRVDSEDPVIRFRNMLKLLRKSYLTFDPIYSLLRTSFLERTALFPLALPADTVLAMEMSLVGPFVHVPELLSFRAWSPIPPDDVLFKIMTNSDRRAPRSELLSLFKEVDARIRRHPLTAKQKLGCRKALWDFVAREGTRETYFGIRRLIGGLTGYRFLKRWFFATR